MKLLEHEAKTILTSCGIAVPTSQLITDENAAISAPVVLKAQVLSGRRNKYGGIQIVRDTDNASEALKTVFAANIEGCTAETVLAEELLNIKKEYYLSLLVNRDDPSIELLAFKDGGVDIESQEQTEFFREALTPKTIELTSFRLAEYLGLETHEYALEDLLQKLLTCFIKNDATLIEINPLVLTNNETLVAADCKMTLDDAAAFRHPDWNFYDSGVNSNFVTLNEAGAVATVANGAGLAMATVDAVEAAGLSAANFLDIGGGASEATVLAALEKIMAYAEVNAIIINIFAGITRCDEVAKAIVSAKEKIPALAPLFVRLEGTNLAEAKEILASEDMILYASLEDAIAAAKESLV